MKVHDFRLKKQNEEVREQRRAALQDDNQQMYIDISAKHLLLLQNTFYEMLTDLALECDPETSEDEDQLALDI